MRLLRNNSYNFTVYSDCSFVQDNLRLKKAQWQTVTEVELGTQLTNKFSLSFQQVVIVIVSASRLFIEIFKLFQEFQIEFIDGN